MLAIILRTICVMKEKVYDAYMVGPGGPVCLIAFDLRFNFERENKILYKLFNISSRQTFICSAQESICSML